MTRTKMRYPRSGSLTELLDARTQKTPTCWLWIGNLGVTGYGYMSYQNVTYRAHRLAYMSANGPIPEGLVLDHLCRTRNCVNPDHLEPVTQLVNVMRGESFGATMARRTHCVHGHEFNPKNTRVDRIGRRHCRPCEAARMRRKRAAKLRRVEMEL
jgi:hypothetical protein